jgi:acyl-CoA synthetase (AMP-forming)/AMP-acid ligase II
MSSAEASTRTESGLQADGLPGQVWSEACERYARDVALISEAGRELTYADWAESARRLAGSLIARGVRPGDRVGLGFTSGPAMVQAYLCGAISGIVLVPISHRSTAAEIGQQLEETNAVAMLHGPEVAPAMETLNTSGSSLKFVLTHEDSNGFIECDDANGSAPRSLDALSPDDPYCIMYTGGTTGSPKGAIQTHLSWYCCIDAVATQWSLTSDDVHLQALPMCHVSWFTTAATLAVGGKAIIMGRWNAVDALDAIERRGVTVLNMPPTMLVDVMDELDRHERDLSKLRFLSVPGVVMPPEIYERARARFGDILGSVYGMTETSGPVTFLLPGEMIGGRAVSGGRPSKDVVLKILEPEVTEFSGNAGLPRESGEIGLGGSHVVKEHANGNRAVPDGESFLRTGDIGAIDEEGYLYVVGRKKDMIKSGGYNVYPREVEDVLMSHPDVAAAAVVGRPDPRWVEAVHCAVVVHPGADTEVDELRGFCRERLAGFKVPKSIHKLDALPYTTSFGKVDKRAIAAYMDEVDAAS